MTPAASNPSPLDGDSSRNTRDDRGNVLPFVLVLMVVGSLIVVPLLVYVSTVLRSGRVSIEKTEAIELAEGGLWTAINTPDVFELCGANTSVPSLLAGVSVTCTVIDTVARAAPTEVPYDAALVQQGVTAPAGIGSNGYVNPEPSAQYDNWLADIAPSAETGKIWVPPLPVRPGAAIAPQALPAGFANTGYSTCTVYFPGTYAAPIVLDEPAYFVSGVYYFSETITIRSGADVVVGEDSANKGCTGDQTALFVALPSGAVAGNSGNGGTFVLGGDARIVVDDAGTAPIRFVMNQRVVGAADVGVAATGGVSIVSVNGDHAPFASPSGTESDAFIVNGTLQVPASELGTGGSAVSAGYRPSTFTPKPTKPEPPADVAVTASSEGSTGALTVTWTPPINNGAVVDSYSALASTGETCTPATPAVSTAVVQPSCTISGVPDGTTPTVTVTATNVFGTSDASLASVAVAPPIDASTLPQITAPSAPGNVTIDGYADGIVVNWDTPTTDGGSPIIGYTVTATPTLPAPAPAAPVVSCTAEWNETSCALLQADGLIGLQLYDVAVVAEQFAGNTSSTGNAWTIPGVFGSGTTPAYVPTLDTADASVPQPILDFTTTSAQNIEVAIDGHIAVPQGRIKIDSAAGNDTGVTLQGGVVAATLSTNSTAPPARLLVRFDNPIAQKLVRITSTAGSQPSAVGNAFVQINKSGGTAINSWLVQ